MVLKANGIITIMLCLISTEIIIRSSNIFFSNSTSSSSVTLNRCSCSNNNKSVSVACLSHKASNFLISFTTAPRLYLCRTFFVSEVWRAALARLCCRVW